MTNSATLTVFTNVSATALIDLSKCPGQSATFSVTAVGSPSPSYQWKKDGGDVGGVMRGAIAKDRGTRDQPVGAGGGDGSGVIPIDAAVNLAATAKRLLALIQEAEKQGR